MAIGQWADKYIEPSKNSGGGDLLIVNGTPQGETSGTTDRAYAELEAASAAGKVIVLNIMGTSAILSNKGVNYMGYLPTNTTENSMELMQLIVARGVSGEAVLSFTHISLG